MKHLRSLIMQNLIVGLIVLTPIVVTIYTILALLNFADLFLFTLLPQQYRPDVLIGFRIPGLGIAFALLLVFVAGFLARNYLGKQLFLYIERGVSHVPVLRGVYFALRQFLESLFVDRSGAFRKVVIIEYPRQGLYTLAFVTSSNGAKYLPEGRRSGEAVYSVFVPTTPNPTSGFLVFVPASQAMDVPLRVEEAFRLVVSGGVLTGDKLSILDRLGLEDKSRKP